MDVKPILNIDDSAIARAARTDVLARAGFSVEERENVSEAVAVAPYSALLVLGVGLQDRDELAVCQRLKYLAPTLPIVMITSAYRTAQARLEAFAAGADAFLLDPLDPDRFVRTVRRLIAGPLASGPALEETWIQTDSEGIIQDLSDGAATLLRVSRRGARGRSLLPFFADNRPRLMREVERAASGVIIQRTTTLRPRDGAAVRVHLDISALASDRGECVLLQWSLARALP